MRNFVKLDTAPLNSPLSLFSASCHPQTVKHCNENPLSCHPFPPKLLPTCENIGLQSRLHPIHAPRCTPPSPKSHVIPPGPHSSTAQKPRNINDPISNSETFSRELRAKLLSCTTVPGAPRPGPSRSLRGLAAVPVGGGRARTSTRTPDRRPTRGLRGLADTTQHRRRRRCGGRRQDQDTHARPIGGRRGACGARPRCRRAAAGPGRASRSTTPSRRLACGDLAGGPPPTGTHSGPAHSGRPRGGRKSGGPQQAVPRAAAAQ